MTVHTGKGTASSTHRYYNKTWYVWNNTGDAAYLRDAQGVLEALVHLDLGRARLQGLLTGLLGCGAACQASARREDVLL